MKVSPKSQTIYYECNDTITNKLGNFYVRLFTFRSKNVISYIIIKITIFSIVISLKNSYFPLIHWPSCYRTVCYRTACYRTVCYRTVQQTNHIQSCSLNQPITTLVSITIVTVYKLLNWGFLQNGEFFPLEQ